MAAKSSDQPYITVGQFTNQGLQLADLTIECEDQRLRPHLERPWMRAYLEKQLRQPLPAPAVADHVSSLATIDWPIYQRHGFCCGTTGGGKSRASLSTMLQHIHAGGSLLLIDGKGETVSRLILHLADEGFPPEQVLLIDPARRDSGPPGFNTLAADLPLLQAVGDLVHVVEETSRSWGNRLADILTNSLIIAGGHQLSVYEATRLPIRDDYRERLLSTPVTCDEPLAYAEAVSFFQNEYSNWSRGEKSTAVGAVTNKVREWLRSPFLRSFLCARANRLDLASLWTMPQVVLATVDRSVLGDDSARLLVSLLANSLLRTALRNGMQAQSRTVLLALDELGILERYIGPSVCDTLAIARSQGLSLLCCFQHFDQLADDLRASLLSLTGYQLLFRLGPDARLAAASIAVGQETRVNRVTVTAERADRETGEVPQTEWAHRICDAAGRPLRLTPEAWDTFSAGVRCGSVGISRLKALALSAGARRLYVRAADTGEPVELCRYIQGLSDSDVSIGGPGLQLVVRFPRPRLSGIERSGEADVTRQWTRCLQELPVQHCVLRLAGQTAGVVKVLDLPTPEPTAASVERWIAASVAANGQSPEQIAADIRWRQEQVEREADGRPPRQIQDDDDESIF